MECSDRSVFDTAIDRRNVGSDIALRVCDSRRDLFSASNSSPLKRKTISAICPFPRPALIFEDPGAATLTYRASISFLDSVLKTNGMYSSVCIIITRVPKNCKSYFRKYRTILPSFAAESLCIAQKAAFFRLFREKIRRLI